MRIFLCIAEKEPQTRYNRVLRLFITERFAKIFLRQKSPPGRIFACFLPQKARDCYPWITFLRTEQGLADIFDMWYDGNDKKCRQSRIFARKTAAQRTARKHKGE